MSLPLGGPWPPRPHDEAFDAMSRWDAWYVGSSDGLTAAYNQGAAGPAARDSQFAGGIVGATARLFWGRPGTQHQRRSKMHMPVAADLCRTSAQLLFAEPPALRVQDGNDAASKRLDRIANTPAMHSLLLEAAEVGAALGGTCLRVVWDTDVADHAMLDAVDADRVIPTFRWGKLVAVTFWTLLPHPEGDSRTEQVWRHLERHEPGVVLHGLYRGTADKLGMMMPLEDHPATVLYAADVDAEGGIPTGVDSLTAAYVPNARPVPAWRNKPGLVELGRSDLDGVEPLMDFIDETWTSLARDVRLAKARLIVPSYMLSDLGVGRGSGFDTDQEVYSPVNVPPSEQGAAGQITPQQFAIRVEEHLGSINAALREVLRAAGYSPITFGLPDEVAATATEVNARTALSNQTRSAKTRHWKAGLAPLLRTLLEVDAGVFKTGVSVSEELLVEFPAPQEPLEVRARTAQLMDQARAASTQRKVETLQPGLDSEGVRQEVERIQAEQGMAVPDPTRSVPA